MRLLLFFILFVSGVTSGQDDTRNILIAKFKNSICGCFEKKQGSYASENLSIALNQCGVSFLIDNESDIQTLASQMTDSLTDYQKGQILGFEIMKESAPALISSCSKLDSDLALFKEEKMSWLKISKENAREKVISAESRINEVTDATKLGPLYYYFGMMYEVDGDYEKAQRAYSKSLKVYPSLIAILLQAQLALKTK